LKVSQKTKCYMCYLLSNSSILDFKISLSQSIFYTCLPSKNSQPLFLTFHHTHFFSPLFTFHLSNPTMSFAPHSLFFTSLHFPSLKPYHVFRTLHLSASSNPSHLSISHIFFESHFPLPSRRYFISGLEWCFVLIFMSTVKNIKM